MDIIKLENRPEICDRIDFEIKDGKIAYINFSLNGENVLKDVKELLTESDVSELDNTELDEKYHEVIDELKKGIEKSARRSQIKNGILKIKKT